MASYRNSDTPPPIMQGSPPALVPPRADWDRPPWNRWAFQHIRELLPTAEVWRGTGPVRVLPRADKDFSGLAVTGVDGATTDFAGLLDQTYTDGFLLLKDGAIVIEQYFNGMEPRSLHLSQSVAKSFTGAVAGILAGRGLLDVNAPVTAYLPELAETGWKGASLQHVLDMSTGTRFSEEYTDPYSDIGQVDVASGWKPIPPGADPAFRWPRHMWELITGLRDTERPHGDLFVYRSIETDVLAFCMERVTGKRLPQIMSEELWQKMGAEESACFAVDSAGYALADGGLNASLRDYGRFGQLMLENGGGIIPAGWVEATRNGNHAIFRAPYTVTLPQGAYRNQFWIEDPVSRALYCRGVFGQMIYVNWQHRLVAVKLSSWPDFLNAGFTTATMAGINRIAEALA
ncbi:MAG: beta-lactamase family protein [Proteobacteria bacterium]|nr:beta-lactamase family protein [Pseudomonadota bacterium]